MRYFKKFPHHVWKRDNLKKWNWCMYIRICAYIYFCADTLYLYDMREYFKHYYTLKKMSICPNGSLCKKWICFFTSTSIKTNYTFSWQQSSTMEMASFSRTIRIVALRELYGKYFGNMRMISLFLWSPDAPELKDKLLSPWNLIP